MKRIILFTLLAAALTAIFATAALAADMGAGVAAVAEDVVLIKSGLCGQKMQFSDTDFKTALGIADFGKITMHTLPSAQDGVLMLGDRRVSEGQTIRRRDIARLTFIPTDKTVDESEFYFSLDRGSEAKILCRMRFLDRINYAPTVAEGSDDAPCITTQSGISVYGKLTATDPEGDMLEYSVIKYPAYGTLKIDEKGEFIYTPTEKRCGYDKFVYTVRDEYGNYTKPQTVTLKVIERMSDVVFCDMKDRSGYNAAVSMSAMGIMSGSRLGDDIYFNPDGSVSRAEFVAMAMKALSVKADTTLTSTFFDDNDSIPSSLVSYVATAARCGIVNGAFENNELNFRPNDTITRCEAAIIMSNLISLKSEYAVFSEIDGIDTVPVWARPHGGAMYEVGVFSEGDELNMQDLLTREDVAEYLYKLMQG